MTAAPVETVSPVSKAPTRTARALIGWMPFDHARRTLAGRSGRSRDPEIVERVRNAHQAVADRVGRFTPREAVYDVPTELDRHIEALMRRPEFGAYRRSGWGAKIADLSAVCAFQELVYLKHASIDFNEVTADDMQSLAKICLPLDEKNTPVKTSWSADDQRWSFVADTPNLNIAAHFSGPQDIGGGYSMEGCGFCIQPIPSFMQVIFHRGRYILRDGYHRAVSLISRGITRVPVLYRQYGEFENLQIDHGNLAEPTYLGNNPALLSDYLDDSVSADVAMSVKKTIIVVEARKMIISV